MTIDPATSPNNSFSTGTFDHQPSPPTGIRVLLQRPHETFLAIVGGVLLTVVSGCEHHAENRPTQGPESSVQQPTTNQPSTSQEPSMVQITGDALPKRQTTNGMLPAKVQDDSGDKKVPVLATLPAFTFSDQAARPFGSDQLHGTVWIANFIFTRCHSACPMMTVQMGRFQAELKQQPSWSDIRLVSFSVDPEHDTPGVLHQYAQKAQADEQHWKFLTGTRQQIWALSQDGFRLPIGDESGNADMPIVHSQKFVLVDRVGRIRGYYDGLTDAGRGELTQDLMRMLEEPLPQRLPIPEEVLNPPWLEERRQAQLATADTFEAFSGFQFTDRVMGSGITFRHRIVDDAGKYFKKGHYDHGNGIAIADIDGDGLLDIYFVTQLGANELWKNLGSGRFQNITESAGVALTDKIGATASFADIDNDGDPDLYVTTVRGGNVLFENDGTGRFTDITETSGLGYVGHASGAVFFDYDRDGLLDLFLCNVGVYTTDRQGRGGYYIAYKDAFSGQLEPERSESSILFRNTGHNRFVDVSSKVRLVDQGWSGDASPIDLNEDGWPDLYVLNMQGNDEYYENVKGTHFVKKSRAVFPKTPWGSMGIKAFDYDNDGDQDLFITDMHSDMPEDIGPEREKLKARVRKPESILRSGGMSLFGNAFYRNEGDGTFTEISDQIGAENYWPWGVSVGDLNADGYDDVFIASSMNLRFRYGVNSVLLNDQGRAFVDSEFILGVEPRRNRRTAKPWFHLDCSGADSAHRHCNNRTGDVVVWAAVGTRSSAIFDLDNDGDLDIVTNEFNDGPMVLVSNLSERKAVRYLKVTLTGRTSNRSGLGATVLVKVGSHVYTKVHDGQSGYLSQSLCPLYFGLDDADHVDRIDVQWPSGLRQTLSGPIAVNTLIDIEEDARNGPATAGL